DLNQCHATEQISSNSDFSVDDVSVNEAAGTATSTVSRAGGGAASVDLSVTPGTASTPADFTAPATTLVFPPGQRFVTYGVVIKQDNIDEPNETYTVRLSDAVNGSLIDDTGIGTIVDDDPPARISVNDVIVTEGNTGTTNLVFRVRLSRPST